MIRLVSAIVATLTLFGANNSFAADIDWEGWSFDYSTNSNSSGLVLTNVTYNGELILGKASMPVMRVEYENDICGPYADILSSSRLEPANTGAPNDVCDGQSVCRRTFTQDGEKKLEIGSNWQIGEYQIYQTYYFSEDGYIDTRVYSRGLQCVISHAHHAHWMFDFDIGDSANDRILRGDSEVQETEFNDLKSDTAFWTVEDPAVGTKVRLVPGADDGEPDNFSRWDAAGRKFASSEVGRWQLGARGEIGESFNTPAEDINGEDLVFWYVSHLPHTAAEGSSIWHSSGPRIEVLTTDQPAEPPPAPEPPAPEPPDNNLLVNGDFEESELLTGWGNCGDATRTQLVVADGQGSQVARVFESGCLYQQVQVVAGKPYALSCDAQRSGNNWTIIELSFLDADLDVLGNKDTRQVNTSGDFRTYQLSGRAPDTTAYAMILIYSDDDTQVDACSLVESDVSTPVEPPDVPADGVNLLSNAGFEAGISDWKSCAEVSLLSASTEADSGAVALAVTGGGCIYQEFPVDAGVSYRMSCRAKRVEDTLYSSATLAMLNTSYASLERQEMPVQSTAYEDYSATLTATDASVLGTVVLYSESQGLFDTCEVVVSP